MRPWKINKIWQDQTVFILGGGPSLQKEDVNLLRNRRVIAVNDAFKLGLDWIDICWFTDCRWYIWNAEELKDYQGMIVGCPPCHCDHPRVLQLKRQAKSGISVNPEIVYWNKNSGSSAINLAYLLGANRIVLLGFDMKMQGNQHNWHTNHKHIPRPTIYKELFLPCFDQIALDAKKLNIEIFNTTFDSAIEVFPKIKLSEVLA